MKKLIREFTLKPSGYSNVTFGDGIVGSSKPSTDKINPDLLKDVSKAAQKAGVQVTITTAKTGHEPNGRHVDGDAVDIAMINGLGFSGGKNDAQKKGIYDDIMSFVSALESMGYKKNVESGNEKSVLTFGFSGHENHVHVSKSRKLKGGKKDETTKSVESATLFKGATFKIIANADDHKKRSLGGWESDNAWDIQAAIGTSVYSLTKGKVTKVYESRPGSTTVYGTQVSIEGLDNFPSIFYTHLKNVKLKKGDIVYPGTYIGQITRWESNPAASHVHIGVKGDKNIINTLMDTNGKIKSISSEDGSDSILTDILFDPNTPKPDDLGLFDIFGSLHNLMKPDKTVKEDVDRMKDIMKKIL
jgi:murein DD-endopeptidase MepM/ murein hydrolase activator NlpD